MSSRHHRLIAILALALSSAACYGEMVSTQSAGERFEGVPIDPALTLTCTDPITASDDGHHNEGTNCLGCHLEGGSAPGFSAAGTLFADPDGTTPLSGLHISIIDDGGAELDVTSSLNCNFWVVEPIAFPATAYVSACPDVVPMPILLTLGDCNSCHVAGDRITFSP